MLKHIRLILVNLLTAVAVLVAVMMVCVGYSDRISPVVHPLVGCLGFIFPVFIVANILMLLALLTFCWRRAWIPLVGFLIACTPIRTYIPLNIPGDDTPQEGTIKIVSYNVCGYGGNFKYENALDTLTSYIMAHDADIVCLQEDNTLKHNAVERWKELYPYNDTVSVNNPNIKTRNVLGIHTRLPIVKTEVLEYRTNSNGAAAYYLKYGSDTILVINCHLEHIHLTTKERDHYSEVIKAHSNRDSMEVEAKNIVEKLSEAMVARAPQAEALHQYIVEHSQYPIIVCGDFNDTPISYARHTVAEGLTDCFMEAGNGLGLSYNRRGFNFRIDHFLCSQHFTPITCVIDNKMDASDHYPLISRLKIADKP